MHYHNNAKILMAQRALIQVPEHLNLSKIVAEFRISRQTASKWRHRNFTADKSSRPENIHYALSDEQKILLIETVQKLQCSVEALCKIAWQIGLSASKSTIYRAVKQSSQAVKRSKKAKNLRFASQDLCT